MMMEKFPEKDKLEASLLSGIIAEVTRNLLKDAIGYEITNYDENGDLINIGIVAEVNKSSDSKSDKNNERG